MPILYLGGVINMKKQYIVLAATAIAVLAIATFAYYNFSHLKNVVSQTESDSDMQSGIDELSNKSNSSEASIKAEDADTEKFLSNFGKIGEPYSMKSHYYKQSDIVNKDIPYLGWNGEIKITIHSATVSAFTDKINTDNYKTWKEYLSEMNDPCILTLDITFENINAEQNSGIRYEFNATMFQLGAYQDMLSDNVNKSDYITTGEQYSCPEIDFDKHGDGDNYYKFTIKRNNKINFTLKYLVSHDYFQQKEPFIYFGSRRNIVAGIRLDNIIWSDAT
jgi:hypothetical protein